MNEGSRIGAVCNRTIFDAPTRLFNRKCAVANRTYNLAVIFSLLLAFVFANSTATSALAQDAAAQTDTIPVTIVEHALVQPICSGHFVLRTLPHITVAPQEIIRLFDSNGAGLAVNDLDNDGDLDIVLANLNQPATVLWNEHGLSYRQTDLPLMRRARAVAAVDVDGDGWLDLTFTNGVGAVVYFRNDGMGNFELTALPGVNRPAYAMHWADWDLDGDLDLATASYDAGALVEQGNAFLFGDGGGVTAYENQGGQFVGQRLSDEAQGLAITSLDLDGDERSDLLVGNDFDLPDQAWSRNAAGEWQAITPFAEFTHSTMSFDRADIDNDGDWELFATDMKPFRNDRATVAAWAPLMEEMMARMDEADHVDDPQVMENVLQTVAASGEFQNGAQSSGIDATGWSWSSKFGDLDQDGFVDLYVVNGMITDEMFGHLPDGELIEENQVRRNDGDGGFDPMPLWDLGSTASGRGMSMADLDLDGDLDIVVNNLNSPAQLFENRLCEGASLQVDLRWPDSANPFAIGSEVTLHTADGRTFQRDVRVASGYLSGDPSRLHFGAPAGVELLQFEVRWPDGGVSVAEDLSANALITVTR